ncbi:hypothetical protein N752_21345 [Desulforamulus aquiferis]|nr:hypothetical protein N752_21345 [Desulforamulus aquiferis]
MGRGISKNTIAINKKVNGKYSGASDKNNKKIVS